jgi:glycosyltransferase involved in cell wall biosynthesis
MRIAFYAPLKAPDHPVASGDRQMARALAQALAHAGHDVALASRLRTFDARGDPVRQVRLRHIGKRIASRYVARARAGIAPDLWFTYHLHHKAPDHLGPFISSTLGIPYIVAEASVAPRQREGPWAEGYADALAAIRAADTVVGLNPRDAAEVRRARGARARDDALAPFIDVRAFAGDHAPAARAASPTRVQLVTVAMMREGAKLASYRVLATALSKLCDLRWELSIVGDGPARAEVEAAFASLGERVRMMGMKPREQIARLLAASDLFVWPAVDEAYGVAFLEAQACALPVVGGNSEGVGAVVRAGATGLLAEMNDADGFAAATRRLIEDVKTRHRMGRAAFGHVREHHDLPAAAAHLDAIVRDVAERGAARPDARRATLNAPARAPR